jgi:chorismate mutase
VAEREDVDRRALDDWRRRIDGIDEQLMRLLNSRSACAVEVGRIKRALGLPIYSPEPRRLERLAAAGEEPVVSPEERGEQEEQE